MSLLSGKLSGASWHPIPWVPLVGTEMEKGDGLVTGLAQSPVSASGHCLASIEIRYGYLLSTEMGAGNHSSPVLLLPQISSLWDLSWKQSQPEVDLPES